MMTDIRKIIVNHYSFNDNKKFRGRIWQFIKHIIFVNIDYANINLMFINAYKYWRVNKKTFENVFDFSYCVMIRDQNRVNHVRESKSWQKFERHVIYVDCQERSIWLHKVDLKSTVDINRSSWHLLISKNNRLVDLLWIERLRSI